MLRHEGFSCLTEIVQSGRVSRPRLGMGRVLLISVLLVVPCFWQSRIQAGDLSSHIYNAYLANLIAQGKVSGLWIADQSNNILFDLELEWLLPRVGAAAAQRIAVSIAVLIFAWGAIAFILSIGGRSWLFTVASVSLLAYGFVYHMGFFNFYLSLGICLFYLAGFWQGSWILRWTLTPLLVVAWVAHPFPVAWAAGIAIYIFLAEHVPTTRRLWLLGAGLATIAAVATILLVHYDCTWSWLQIFLVTGANEVFLYGARYGLVLAGLLLVWLNLFRRMIKQQHWSPLLNSIPFQIWVLSAAGVLLIPKVVDFHRYALPFYFVSDRLSLGAGIVLCSLLATVPMNGYECVGLGLATALFFGLLCSDGHALNLVEDSIDHAVSTLPVQARVIELFPHPKNRVDPLRHAIDRACIGHCFSYANYEPSTQQFRIRAQPGNSVVLSEYADAYAAEEGNYVVKARDLPLFGVYWCSANETEVCVTSLREGDVVGKIAPTQVNR